MWGIQKCYLQIPRGILNTDRGRWETACCSAAMSKLAERWRSGFHSSRNILSETHRDPGRSKQLCYDRIQALSVNSTLSKTRQEQEARTAQHLMVSFRFPSKHLPRFPAGLLRMTVQQSGKCCGGSSQQQAGTQKVVQGSLTTGSQASLQDLLLG